jgi:nitrogen fixation protein NifX
MKVAFASSDGVQIDEHFGRAATFHVWNVESDSASCIARLDNLAKEDVDSEDHIVAKANALQGCAIACSIQIGGPAAAKLVARHIHPMKTQSVVPIADMVAKLQNVLRGPLPPWLAKCAGIKQTRQFVECPEE